MFGCSAMCFGPLLNVEVGKTRHGHWLVAGVGVACGTGGGIGSQLGKKEVSCSGALVTFILSSLDSVLEYISLQQHVYCVP